MRELYLSILVKIYDLSFFLSSLFPPPTLLFFSHHTISRSSFPPKSFSLTVRDLHETGSGTKPLPHNPTTRWAPSSLCFNAAALLVSITVSYHLRSCLPHSDSFIASSPVILFLSFLFGFISLDCSPLPSPMCSEAHWFPLLAPGQFLKDQ